MNEMSEEMWKSGKCFTGAGTTDSTTSGKNNRLWGYLCIRTCTTMYVHVSMYNPLLAIAIATKVFIS